MIWRNCGLGLLIWSIAASASAQATCSFDELKQAIKDNDKAFVKACSSKSERSSSSGKRSSSDSVFTPEEQELVWGKKTIQSARRNESSADVSCEDSPRIRAARRDVTSYSSEIADLNSEKRRLDKRLREFDASYERSKPSRQEDLAEFLSAGFSQGAEKKEEMRDRQIRRERKHFDERFELQNQITEMKLQLNREIRDIRRYLADAEDRINRLTASGCQ